MILAQAVKMKVIYVITKEKNKSTDLVTYTRHCLTTVELNIKRDIKLSFFKCKSIYVRNWNKNDKKTAQFVIRIKYVYI